MHFVWGGVCIEDDFSFSYSLLLHSLLFSLSAPNDMSRVIHSLTLCRALLSSPAFAAFNFTEVQPGPAIHTREDIEEWISKSATTGFHYIGTAKMGPKTDPLSVVDPTTMRVHGMSNLYIVDASVAPTSFSANTQSLAMAVAVRGVELIASEWRSRERVRDRSTSERSRVEES